LADDVSMVCGVRIDTISEPFPDTMLDAEESRLARSAFAQLPERWRAVLQRTEIMGQSPAEAASPLDLTANAVSALAMRARRGLREAYLSAHLSSCAVEKCRLICAMLPAWTRGKLPASRAKQLRAHLGDCADCQQQADALAEINATQLRRAAA